MHGLIIVKNMHEVSRSRICIICGNATFTRGTVDYLVHDGVSTSRGERELPIHMWCTELKRNR